MIEEFSWKNATVVSQYLTGKRASIPYAADQIQVMLHLIKHNRRQIGSFIDIGAGDGILSQMLLEKYPEATGALVDFSEPMLEAAKKRFCTNKNRIYYFDSDISCNTWQDMLKEKIHTPVDLVISGYCIHHLTHQRKFELYQEIYDLLSIGGAFINIEHVASYSPWGEAVSDEMFIDSILLYNDKHGIIKSRMEVTEEHHNRDDKKDNKLLLPEIQCTWLRQIGFDDVDVYFKSFEMAVFAGIKKRSN